MKKVLIFSLLITLVLCGCATVQPQDEVSSVSAKSSSTVVKSARSVSEIEYLEIGGTQVAINGTIAVEPNSDLDIWNMSFSDFGTFFEEQYPVKVSSYTIANNSAAKTTVYHIHSDNPGPTVYICAGIHGDERAAWYTGVLMKNATIACGDLYVLSQANIIGATEVSRYLEDRDDPNRFFPGKKNGSLTEYLDYSIYSDIEEKHPDIVLDLHEAIVVSSKKDFLGSTYIFSITDGIDFLFDMVWDTEDGLLCHNAFSTQGPGPIGSLNNTVSFNLGIPTITVETFRGYDIERRVQDQLDTVQYVLKQYDMR